MLLRHDCVGTVWMPDDLCYNSGPVVVTQGISQVRLSLVRQDRGSLPPGWHSRSGLHSDGDLGRLLPDLVACGFDAIHPFEPPMNDIVAVKRQWGDRIAVAGGIDLKRDAVQRHAQRMSRPRYSEMAAALAPGGGWLLGLQQLDPRLCAGGELSGPAGGRAQVRQTQHN